MPLNAAILVLEDANLLSLAATVDPMRAANRRSGRRLFTWEYYTATGAAAALTSGLSVPGPAIERLNRSDLLVVIAGFRLERHATPPLLASLRRLAPHCETIAGIDGGSWLLARAGLLDGHYATTHWEDLAEFTSRFDAITALRHRYVSSGKYLTAGAAGPALDLMLSFIEDRFGSRLARDVAGAFLYAPSPGSDQPQTPHSGPALARRHPVVARALTLMGDNIETPLPITTIAKMLSLSPRSLETRFARALSQSPKSAYLALRMAEAHRLALETNQPVQEIAFATGFSSQSSLSRAFRSAHGSSIRALRQQQLN
ncbi:helix-turn-helix domain-containing protein [Alisedimentitalea sp. MJ-SS2]|uniref:GlxA family transcriptional regulator n=1 Tax=Aliisedimentitalea sp. MJ-SS2 TaxID=3049795 RepID=UPI00290B7BD8|nr:helix-turn-helix domain-containing protein [Alisedimentitalea sp. MJ-SS2]MDU8927102.1 helix-turn-helix domain-containing protein [Alisedimentitalea sp. MJ-SS2]